MRIATIVTFPAPLAVRADVLGTRSRVRIGRKSLYLAMPRARPTRQPFDYLTAPRVAETEDLTAAVAEILEPEEDRFWGAPGAWDAADNVLAASVSSAIVFLDSPVDLGEKRLQATANAISPLLHAWTGTLVDWLEVVSRHDYGAHPSIDEHYGSFRPRGGIVWTGSNSSKRRIAFVNPDSIVSIGVSPRSAIGRATWKRAISAANGGSAPPDEHLLIRDARRALRRDDYRSSILDGATAVEMTLAAIDEPTLAKAMGRRMARSVLDQVTQVSRRLQLLTEADDSFESIQPTLMELRNKVIHSHYRPTKDEAERAYEVASELVWRFVALPW